MKKKLTINGSIRKSFKKDEDVNKFVSGLKKDKEEPKDKTISFRELYRYATCLDFFCMFLGGIFSIGSGLCAPIMMIFFGDATGHFVDYASTLFNETYTEPDRVIARDKLSQGIWDFTIDTVILGVAIVICSYCSTILFNVAALRQIHKIRTSYVQSVLNQDISWYDMHSTGDFTSRITEDLIKIEEGVGEKVGVFIYYASTFLSGVLLALIKGWELALICLISLPLSTLSLGLISWMTTKFAQKETEAYGAAGAVAEETLGAIRTVVAFEGQQKELTRYRTHLRTARDNNIRRSLFTSISTGCMWFCLYGCIALSFWYGVKLILKEKDLPEEEITYTPANMITVFFAVLNSNWMFGQSTPYLIIFGIARGAATKIYEVIDNDPIINKSKKKGSRPKDIKGNITFRNVHFHYPSRRDVKVLQGLDLSIKAGQTVALVGSSGCGKSTCIQLLQRFYDPISGNVLVDDNDVRDLNLTWLRSHIGVVGQEPVLFGTTISENIKYGCRTATQEEVEKAAKKANAHSFIMALPQGYDTLVGERGAQLSGGQKQRIAIARALVRNPTILLLDEATSALDTNSEAKVQEALDSASKDCTTIIVAHRLSTVRNADKIVVIAEGKVVEEGDHGLLMKTKGAYYNLVTKQMNSEEEVAEALSSEERYEELPEDSAPNEDYFGNHKISVVADAEDVLEQVKEGGSAKGALFKVIKLNSPEWWHILLGCVTSVLTGAALPIYSIVFGDIIGILANADTDYVQTQADLFSIYFFIIGVVSGIASFLQMYMFGIAGEKLTMRVRDLSFQAMLNQEIGYFDRKENGVGALCTRLSVDAASIQGASGQPIGTVLNSISTLGLAIGISVYFEWRLALVALSFVPFIFVAIYLEQKVLQRDIQSSSKSLETSAKLAVEAIGNIRTVASLGCEEVFYNLYLSELMPYYSQSKHTAHFSGFALGLARSMMFFSYAASIYYGGILVLEQNLEYGIVFKVSEALITGAWSMGNAMAFSPNFQKALSSTSKIFNLLNRTPRIGDIPDAKTSKMANGNITYSDISFSYPTRPNVGVLRELHLEIAQGKSVALVGSSGCGKSTIIQLLERFYDPKSGKITADGEDLRNFKLSNLRSHLGIVSQEPNLFDKTIAENIAYGDNSREVGSDEIISAAKSANIHNFIASLPLGYETRLGDKGTQLSGGQKQRIAIARALVRNPKVLLLDEATSALDTESEKIVQEALDNAKKGRTCITIAHRLTTIQDADVICVINKGKVAEMGTHSELLNRKGLYCKLHSMQKGLPT